MTGLVPRGIVVPSEGSDIGLEFSQHSVETKEASLILDACATSTSTRSGWKVVVQIDGERRAIGEASDGLSICMWNKAFMERINRDSSLSSFILIITFSAFSDALSGYL